MQDLHHGFQFCTTGVRCRSGPGTAYRYSSYGWIMVSAAVEAAAGRAVLHLRPTREASLRVDTVRTVLADLQAVAEPVDDVSVVAIKKL